ncbi:MAG: cyclic nucleotide-binding domain-containing protein [Desulfobacterales bacterium]|nr:MAG: cyclic nucleotide-binding domain-containing protein [Desulfobacterales bacterium]
MEPLEIEQALLNSEFFKGLEPSDIQNIARICHPRTYRAGEYVFQQGDFGEHLYIIIEGQVFLERAMNLGGRKGSVTLAALGKGRVLGCWSTLLDEPHILMSSASCQRSSQVLVLKGADLRNVMTRDTKLGFNLLERLCFLLRDRIQAAYGALEKI